MPNQLRMTWTVLLVLLFFAGDVLAQFGPAETEEEAAERVRWEEQIRQGYIDKRERLGEAGFKAYAIATLDRLVDARPPWHPRFETLSQQLGTAEYTLRTEPRFFQEVVPMLVEMEANEALPVLAEHVKVMEHHWRRRTGNSLGGMLDVRRWAVQQAWFTLAVEQKLGLDEATQAYAEMTTWPRRCNGKSTICSLKKNAKGRVLKGDEETYDAYRKRREKYSRTMEESLELLHHLYHMVAFDDPDPALIDLCLNSVGYSDGFIHLVRHHENQNITMTGDQLDLTAQWIDNPFISEDHREGIIDGLIRLDHRPAAEAIAGYYQRLGLLDDELNALAKTGVNPKGVPGIRRLAPEKVAWLQKHAE
eukprot:g12553.t1